MWTKFKLNNPQQWKPADGLWCKGNRYANLETYNSLSEFKFKLRLKTPVTNKSLIPLIFFI